MPTFDIQLNAKTMENIKYHKTFGEVKIINVTPVITTIVVVATGEEKKLMTKVAVFTDAPVVKEVKKYDRNWQKKATDFYNNMTTEQRANFERAQKEIAADKARSARDRANGNHGAVSMWK